ncbi:hypothetical protein ElyMa_001894800 [Elysia marginata]|uniref:CCHC-type domain-containing protein n=1 Tax=Elysia marginata TaxID=1093978 RepID=A0AAV4EQM5_9GAST|nr:hypothetical protein ElyMa_001894800 [Elysia marginata]
MILQSHYCPKPLEIVERFKFHKRSQETGENVADFIAAIKRLSEHCNFGAVLQTTLRDRFVCGLRDEAIQKQLLQERDLTFEGATNLALAMEMANRDAHDLHSSADKSIHKIGIKTPGTGQTGTPTPRNQSSRPSFPSCLSCGKTNHKRSNCYFKDATCNKCHKKGHIQTVCKSGQNQNKFLPRNQNKFLPNGIGNVKGIQGTLIFKENFQPKFCKARPVPYALKKKVEQELDNLEKQGIISSVRHSDWATPIVPVLKANGDVCLCGDYKTTVNPNLEAEKYTLPPMEDMLAQLEQGVTFSKIDLRQAYLQLPLDDASKTITTINTSKGLYTYNRLPFGVASSPAIWQKTTDTILQGLSGVQ